EGVSEDLITVSGNTVIDALYIVIDRIRNDENIERDIQDRLNEGGYDTARISGDKKIVLITGHRRENFGTGFLNICQAINTLVNKYPDVDFVYPMHLNPN